MGYGDLPEPHLDPEQDPSIDMDFVPAHPSHVFRIGTKQVAVYAVEVQAEENDQDWQFVFNDMGNGRKVMAVF